MATTEWADTSSHQEKSYDASYPHPVNAYRAVDGTYVDPLFKDNDTWTRNAKSILFYIVYSVFPRSVGMSSWQETFHALIALLGTTHRPRLVLMDDTETWNRSELHRDWSAEIEAKRQAEVAYLNSLRPKWQHKFPWRRLYLRADNRRVIGYGNRGDLLSMAGKVKWRYVILADYSSAPTPGRLGPWRVIGRQYTSSGICKPFGHCDMNRALMSPRRLARALGLGRYRWTF